MSKESVCSWCIHKADRKMLQAKHGTCMFCGEMKEPHRLLISPYCYECASQVNEQSRKCSVAVKKEILAGNIPRLDGSIPCIDCGEPAEHYDHRDYNKPLDISAVCRSCNYKRGPAEKFGARKVA